MLIAEEFLLITRSEDRADTVGQAEVPVAGALLCELALAERVSLVDGRIAVVDASSTGDDLLDEALTRFAARAGKKPRDTLLRVGRGLPALALGRLRQAEVLHEEPARALGVRLWSRWRVIDTTRRDALREELLAVLTEQREPDGRTGSLIALLHATRGLRNAFPTPARQGIPLRELNRRAKEVAQGRWGAAAVGEAIQAAAAVATTAAIAGGAD